MQIRDKMVFSKYTWRVLSIQTGKALLLSEKALEHRSYHNEFIDITWEQCALRQYLNNDFLNTFSYIDRDRIVKSSVANTKNPRHKTDGGVDTTDYIFLLSIEENIQYFGDFSQYYSEWKTDPYKNARRTKNVSGKLSGW